MLLVPNLVPQWGAVPFTVPDLETPGGPPDAWRAGLEKVRSRLRSLSVFQGVGGASGSGSGGLGCFRVVNGVE